MLEGTARRAESIGKAAMKYFVPSTIKSGMAVVKPFLRRRRSTYSGQQAQWPRNYWMTNTNARSAIVYPNPNNNWLLNPLAAAWQYNPYLNYWGALASRSVIAGYPYPQYYPQQQYYNNLQTRTVPYTEANGAQPGNDEADTRSSLQDFQKLVSKVDSALISYSKKAGVTLKENLKGVESRHKDDNITEKRSKSAKEQQKEQVKIITNTFTDFVCADNC